jgi:hypothetical protein
MSGSKTAPSGSALLCVPSDRVPSQRLSIAGALAWPELGIAVPGRNVWDEEFPRTPLHARIEAAESGRATGALSNRNDAAVPLLGRERSHLKGGGLTMRRILAVLSALAALFLVGGANAKF